MAEVKKAASTVKKAAAKKVETVKAEVKKAEPVVKAAEQKVTKKATETKEAAKKATTKVAAAAKTTAKKAATKKADIKTTLNVQFAGKDYAEKDLVKMAKDSYKKSGNKAALKTLSVYVNVDDQIAYYVANGEIKGQFEI